MYDYKYPIFRWVAAIWKGWQGIGIVTIMGTWGDALLGNELTHCGLVIYRKVSNIRRTKSQNLNASHLIL